MAGQQLRLGAVSALELVPRAPEILEELELLALLLVRFAELGVPDDLLDEGP